jgi:hypothetical protein
VSLFPNVVFGQPKQIVIGTNLSVVNTTLLKIFFDATLTNWQMAITPHLRLTVKWLIPPYDWLNLDSQPLACPIIYLRFSYRCNKHLKQGTFLWHLSEHLEQRRFRWILLKSCKVESLVFMPSGKCFFDVFLVMALTNWLCLCVSRLGIISIISNVSIHHSFAWR